MSPACSFLTLALAYVINLQCRFSLCLGLLTAFYVLALDKALPPYSINTLQFSNQKHKGTPTHLTRAFNLKPSPKLTKIPPLPYLKGSIPLLRDKIIRNDHDRFYSRGRRMEVSRLSRHTNPFHLLLSALQRYAHFGSTAFYVDYSVGSNHRLHCHHHQQPARRQTHQLHPGSLPCNLQLLLRHLVSCLDRACGGVPALLLFENRKSENPDQQHLYTCSQANAVARTMKGRHHLDTFLVFAAIAHTFLLAAVFSFLSDSGIVTNVLWFGLWAMIAVYGFICTTVPDSAA